MPDPKKSYVVACASAFRDAVMALANRHKVNAGDIARSVMLIFPSATIADFPDPGEPGPDDRETVVLKSGPSAGKPWRRKPRLQVRLPAGHSVPNIRRALGLALAMDGGRQLLSLEAGDKPTAQQRVVDLSADIDRLRNVVETLSFRPLANGVKDRHDALHVLDFSPKSQPTAATVNSRYRALAAIHHPDSPYGDNRRMGQLNDAVRLLRRKT